MCVHLPTHHKQTPYQPTTLSTNKTNSCPSTQYDFQSLFQFLRVHPVQDKSVFQQVVSKPIQLGEEQGLTRLRLLLSTVSLRRAKAIIAGSVPPKTCVDSRVRLTGRAEDVYAVLFKSARLVVKALLQV